MTTINVMMLKNSPRMPNSGAERPFAPAITAHNTAAITLPTATKIPLMPLRMNPAASTWVQRRR